MICNMYAIQCMLCMCFKNYIFEPRKQEGHTVKCVQRVFKINVLGEGGLLQR